MVGPRTDLRTLAPSHPTFAPSHPAPSHRTEQLRAPANEGRVAGVAQASDEIVGKGLRDLVRGGAAGRIVPAWNPVDRSEDDERCEPRVPPGEDAGPYAVGENGSKPL